LGAEKRLSNASEPPSQLGWLVVEDSPASGAVRWALPFSPEEHADLPERGR
jgi:hypothetical protein